MKAEFLNMVFSNELRVSLDGPDAWTYGWGGSVICVTEIFGSPILRLFQMTEGIKMNSQRQVSF